MGKDRNPMEAISGNGGGVSGGTDHGEGQGQGSSDLGEVTECDIFTGQCSFL